MLSKPPLCGTLHLVLSTIQIWPHSSPPHFRIMKARKTMKNQALIQEVISQISQRFAPKIPDIKKVPIFLIFSNRADLLTHQAIETLLEKEYMERIDGSKDTFAYIA